MAEVANSKVSAADLKSLDALAKHLGELAGLIGADGGFNEKWFEHPDHFLEQIPQNQTQRDAIIEILTDVWPEKGVLKSHPILDDQGKPNESLIWLEIPGRKTEDPADGYPTALYVVGEKDKSEVTLGVGMTYRYEPKDSTKLKAKNWDDAKKAAKKKARAWVNSQFVIQPFVYSPLVGMPADKPEDYFALGTDSNRLMIGLDIHLKANSRVKLPYVAIRVIFGVAFRPHAKPPSFQVFAKEKGAQDFKLLHAPDIRKYLNALLALPNIQAWLEELLPNLPNLDLYAWLEKLNFTLPDCTLPKYHLPDFSLDLDFEQWLKTLRDWLLSFLPSFKFPHINISWLLNALMSLKLPQFTLPSFPEFNFSLDLHKEIKFGFQIKDKQVFPGPKARVKEKLKKGKGDKKKVILQLGETFGLEGAASWLGTGIKPGVNVTIGTIVGEGTNIEFKPNPSLELASVGLDIEGAANTPLMDVKGLRLVGIGPRLYLKVSKNGVDQWGVGAKLKKIGIPLGSALKSGGGGNEVVKSLLASGGGDKDASGDKAPVNPEFGIATSYLEDDRLSVHLFDDKDQPAQVVMIPYQRSFGPLHLRKVGVGWEDKDRILSLIVDGEVKVKALSVDLENLSIGIPVTHPTDVSKYKLGLDGIGIQYQGGPVEITGAFVERKLPTGETEYAGAATVKAATWSLGALGAYAYMKNPAPQSGGYASMFVFLLVESVIGGPPCFFVQGLAGGFGYNRKFIPPKLEDVQHFPLLRALSDPTAIGGPNAGPAEALEILDPYVSPSHGDYWFAAGVRFTSFELIDSSALLVVEFGHSFSLTLLGLSTLKLPKEGSPIANVELALEVVLKPDQGTLLARAVLTDNSWVIDKACKLTGGFAFALWFGENPQGAPVGDFVLTVGGYHPHFQPPSHYPKVPRLGFNWPVSGNLSIKGEAYFALTPAQVMAGGGLEVLFHSGDLKAWFRAQMDVLIGWDPFHYEISIKVSIGASYRLHLLFVTVTVSIELGADLEVWGPPMGGVAHVHWFIISFSVGFGAKRKSGVPAIPWEKFEERLLPKPNSPVPVVRIQPNAGVAEMVPEGEKDKRWIVRGDHFAFSTTSTIPARKVTVDSQTGAKTVGKEGAAFSIRPMQLENVDCHHCVWIEDQDGDKVDLPVHWDCSQDRKSLPQALWGEGPPPDKTPAGKGDELLLHDLLTGLKEARPNHPKIAGPPPFVMDHAFKRLPIVAGQERDSLAIGPHGEPTGKTPGRQAQTFKVIHDTIKKTSEVRDKLFSALLEFGVDAGTNEMPTGIANDPGSFEAEPMIGVS